MKPLIVLVAAMIVLGGCQTTRRVDADNSARRTAVKDGKPDSWMVAEKLRDKLGSLAKLKNDQFMTDAEYAAARRRAIDDALDNAYITNASYLHTQMVRVDTLRKEGLLSEEEYQQVRTQLMKQFLGTASP